MKNIIESQEIWGYRGVGHTLSESRSDLIGLITTRHIVATGQFDHFHVSSRPYNRNPFFFFSFLF